MHHQLTQSRIFKIPKGVRITSKLILKSFSMRTLVVIALAFFYVLEYSFWSWHCCSIGGYHKTGTTGTDKVTQRRRRTTAVKRKLSRFTSTTSRQESSSACCLAITSQAAQPSSLLARISSLLGLHILLNSISRLHFNHRWSQPAFSSVVENDFNHEMWCWWCDAF